MVKTPPTSVLEYDTKQSDAEAPVMLELLGNVEYSLIAIAHRSILTWSGSTW